MKQVRDNWVAVASANDAITCTTLQTDSHASTLSLNFYSLGAFPDANQQHQSTEGNFM